jgi:NAD(P)-dependent dehydrogenase (short-subunit alcohol dehydrogenase family)
MIRDGTTASDNSARPEVVFITGSASGVGEASALRLMDRGVKVFGFDISPASERLSANPAYSHHQGDAGNLDLWDQALRDSKAAYGCAPSAVVFCAARLIIGSTVTLEEQDWKAIFETNLFGPVRALKRVIPLMTVQGGGSIVFINSSDGLVAEQNLAAYCASKGAGLQLMRALAIDHARQGIRANAICPGSIETPFFMRHVHAAPDPEAFLAAKTGRHPLGRLMQPVDIAALVDFLASQNSAGITGTSIPVDGGLVAAFDFYQDQAEKERDASINMASP